MLEGLAMEAISKQLVELTKKMKKEYRKYTEDLNKARAGRLTREELDLTWSKYVQTHKEVSDIENLLTKIGVATIEKQKARWWLDFGVHEDVHKVNTSLVYPNDSFQVGKLRYEESMAKAQADFDTSSKLVSDLETSAFSARASYLAKSWLEEQQRVSELQAEKQLIIEEESAAIRADFDAYCEQNERQINLIRIDSQIEKAEAKCRETADKIRQQVRSVRTPHES